MASDRPARRVAAFALALLAGCGVTLGTAVPASAHPLGNATVNHYDGLAFTPGSLTDTAVEDVAEIPTFQRRPDIDTDGDGRLSDAERARYAAGRCTQLRAAVSLRVGERPLTFRLLKADYSERPGAIGLTIGRLTCTLRAGLALDHPSTVAFDDQWDSSGIGWHEVTAVSQGLSLVDSPFPARSISDALLHYPVNLLASPLDVHGGTVRVDPAGGASTYALARRLPVAGPALRLLNHLANAFNAVVGRRHLTVAVGLLAVLLAVALGAGHAFLPGHGKTIMAAYLVGRRGRLRDVALVGATVTLTHTAGVLVLGLAIAGSAGFAPTAVEQVLAVASGLLVAGVGVGLLASAVRRRRASLTDAVAAPPVRQLVPAGHPAPSFDHTHPHPDDHDHDHGHGHQHGFSRGGLLGLGVAGGLVPSPSALLVLLAAVNLGRTAFGVSLVLAYGVGMALALSAAGLLLVKFRSRLDRMARSARLRRADRLVAVMPVLTALLVVLVGVGLSLRALGGAV